jgi:hypothetical protein
MRRRRRLIGPFLFFFGFCCSFGVRVRPLGADGGLSSRRRRRPGLGGDGGPWRRLVVVVVGPFLVSVIRWVVMVVV